MDAQSEGLILVLQGARQLPLQQKKETIFQK